MKSTVLKSLVLSVGLLAPLSFLASNASASRSSWSISYSSYGGHHGSYYKSHHRSYGSHYGHRSYRHYPSYSYSRHRYYSRPRVSVSIGRGHYGGYYSALPFGYRSCVVGGLTYYTHSGRYYRPHNTGYVVVSDPYLAPRTTTTVTRRVSSKYDAYPRIWVSGKEYLIDEGEIFCITSSGLVWAELPLGSIASSLPTHASSVWYKDVEYFEAGGLHFQRVPEGYRLILPPWEQEF